MAKKPISSRNLKLSDQIQRDLAQLIQRELRDPRLGLITIQGVELTPDYAHAKVFYTVLGGVLLPDVVQSILNARAGYLHACLFKRLHIHTVPTLHFHRDTSIEHGIAMSQLIDRALSEGRVLSDEQHATPQMEDGVNEHAVSQSSDSSRLQASLGDKA
ncbi:MAG: 30S ribosome-binding factor RbfA [Ottowia sp.]|nr:30S ribosome-binding factor RbfA [Ottowia sp.]